MKPSDRMMATEVRTTLAEVVRLCVDASAADVAPDEALRLVRTARSQLETCVRLCSHLLAVAAKLDLQAPAAVAGLEVLPARPDVAGA